MFRFLSLSAFLLATCGIISAAEPVTHRVLAADRGKGHIAILGTDGKVEWEMENKHDVHDLHLLANGNILTHTSSTNVVEIDIKKKEIVWKYEAKPKEGYKGRIEIHAFQRLDDGNTMVAESGNTRIVEVDKAGKIVKEIPLKVKQPNAHRDTRMVRKLASGNYLVCHEGEGAVVEYDGEGKVVWSYKLDLGDRKRSDGHGVEGHGVEVFGAVRLENGNTLIAGGNNNRVLEVDPKGKIVWQIDQKDLPGITLAWVTTLQVLPNGNIVIGNCHAGPDNPQLIEVTKDKKVVWTMKDHKNFANDTASAMILDVKGKVIR
jgi:outer membrane protein assembly factor BamB